MGMGRQAQPVLGTATPRCQHQPEESHAGGTACNPGDVTSAGDTTSIPEQVAWSLPSGAGAAARPRRCKPTWKCPKFSRLPSNSSAKGRTDPQPAPQCR